MKNCLSCDKDLVPNDEKQKLLKYSKEHIGNGFRTDYKFPEGKDFGRLTQVPFTGLGTFCKSVKGYLANGIYLDIDAVNCHPVILRNEFVKKGIDISIIDEYVNNREDFLQQEQISKDDFLRMINKEDFVSKNEKLTKLHHQIYKFLLPSVLEENKDIHGFIKKSRAHNKHGAFIANYLQSLEFKILLAMSSYSEKEGVFVDVLMHDGFFVRLTETVNEEYMNKEMIPKYEKFVLDQFGMNMKFKIKPHDLSLVIPDIGDKTQLEIHTEALMLHTKKEELRKFGNLVFKKKNNHSMYYEDYFDAYNQKNVEKPKTLNDFFDEIFDNDKAFNSNTKHKDELLEYVSGKKNFEDFPEMIRSTNYIAFKNGSLQLHPLEFFTLEEIAESSELNKYIARHYIDEEFSRSQETSVLDKFLLIQLSPEAYHILRVLIGRLFFDLNIHDKW